MEESEMNETNPQSQQDSEQDLTEFMIDAMCVDPQVFTDELVAND